MRRPSPLAVAALAAAAPLTACDLTEFEFEHRRPVSIELDLGPGADLRLSIPLGDLHVRGAEGPPRLSGTLHEHVAGDAELVVAGGSIELRTRSGDGAALGDVTLELPAELGRLVLEVGVGDLRVRDLAVVAALEVDSGVGDVSVERIGRAGRVTVDSGTGDVRVAEVSAERLEIDSGVGDVRVTACRADRLGIDSGMGDVRVTDTEAGEHSVDVGLGRRRLEIRPPAGPR